MFSVGDEKEAEDLIVLTCPTNYQGEYFARELVQEQTLENLGAFGARLQKAHDEVIVPNGRLQMSMIDDELEKLRLQQTLVTLISLGSIVTRPTPELITVCPYCDQPKPDIATRRINTLYHDDESNWMTSCLDCYKETIAHYNEMWSDYYAGCT